MGWTPDVTRASRSWRTNVKDGDLRDCAISIQEKRSLREKRQTGVSSSAFWGSRIHLHRSCLRSARNRIEGILSYCKLWQATLNGINGRFGPGICSYFSLLRLVILLNLVSLTLTTGLLIIPTLFCSEAEASHNAPEVLFKHASSPHKASFYNMSSGSTFFDIFTGEGILENSFLFYGYYAKGRICDSTFRFSLMYLLTPLIYLLVCGFCLLRCTVRGLTLRRIRRRDYRTPISSKVFSGWDFCVRGTGTSVLKQQSLSNEIKSHLAEERWFWETEGQPFGKRIRILVIRVLLNSIILTVMAGAFYCIHLATGVSQYYEGKLGNSVLSLNVQYLVPIIISLVLLILPPIFMFLVRFEGHSPSTEIHLTLIRCVFLRLGTLGIFLFSMGQKILCFGSSELSCETWGNNTHFQCWETSVGQEFYKLSVFHFLKVLMEFLLLQLPRKFLVSHSQCFVVRWLGREEFQLPQNVLDTVYGQTLVWGGLFYSPLLPLFNIIFIFITFYIQKFCLYHLCDVPQKLFRESTSRILFHFVLLLGLMTVFFPLIYMVTSVQPSRSCGLFTEHSSAWEAVQNSSMSALPPAVLTVLGYITSEHCAYSLLIVLSLLVTSYATRVHQYEHIIEELKDNLFNQIQDKIFLVKKLKGEHSPRIQDFLRQSNEQRDIVEPVLPLRTEIQQPSTEIVKEDCLWRAALE
ncbi:transmembrane channel-like protein 8 [Rhinophrynus dorsalis]